MYYIVKLINKILNNYSSNLIKTKTIQLDQESSGLQYKQSLNPLLKSKGVIAVVRLWRQRQVYQIIASKYKSNYKKLKTISTKVKRKPKLIKSLI
jgi:hypothetical protein